ncbi:MAG: hypothetical protein R3F35_00525 [Myxococcota bacterium]
MAQTGGDPRERGLRDVLEATEALRASIAAGEEPSAWLVWLERRERAVGALERTTADAWTQSLSGGGRTLLARIAELDARMIQDGREELTRLQRERHELGRRRRAVHAHGLQERSLARAVTVKA